MFKVGQKVWCAIYGAGVVAEVAGESAVGNFCIDVKFKDGLSISYTNDGKWLEGGNITLFPYPVEIVKAITKPSIDWSHVSPEYNYLAQDANGRGYLCGKNPHRIDTAWSMESPYISASTFTSYTPGTCNWKDSLVKRPN